MTPAKRHRLGLVVGKFSPLHLGHEYLIEQAIDRCDAVLVLGYSQPVLPGCERARRKAWFAARFPKVTALMIDDDWLQRRCRDKGLPCQRIPDNDAPDAIHQTFLSWLLQGPIGAKPDAMLASEPYVFPCAERLSRDLGHAVQGICVDPERTRHPFRASVIRSDIHAHRHALSPQVYRDFVRTVVFLGGESSGKTSLARSLAERHGTAWVAEYGRELWDRQNGVLSLADLLHIGATQIEREDARRLEAQRYLFCDTSPLTTLGYAGWMFDEQPQELQRMAHRNYDLIVLCELDFGFVQDGTRRDEAFRREQHHWYQQRLQELGTPFVRASGPLAERIATVDRALPKLPR
jgi:HTH-type transcriptional regulator, transcriptional repressor of NAD biosynthesis genes